MSVKLQNSKGGELKFIDIGRGNSLSNSSWNVASILPNIYNTLTINNFGIYSISMSATKSGSSAASAERTFLYNANNGSLSLDTFYIIYQYNPNFSAFCHYSVGCYYIE